MSLPHYTDIKYNYNPIYDCNIFVNFENKILSDNCISIEDNIMKFNLFIQENELFPYFIIKDFIENKKCIKYLELCYFDKFGNRVFSIFLKNFSFIDILKLKDFNLENFNIIKNLLVSFKFDEEYVIMSKDYDKFIRKIKLENINENF